MSRPLSIHAKRAANCSPAIAAWLGREHSRPSTTHHRVERLGLQAAPRLLDRLRTIRNRILEAPRPSTGSAPPPNCAKVSAQAYRRHPCLPALSPPAQPL